MRKISVLGRAIYFMTENDSYPRPSDYDNESFAVWHDEEGQYWIDVYYQREWRRAFSGPLKDMEAELWPCKTIADGIH